MQKEMKESAAARGGGNRAQNKVTLFLVWTRICYHCHLLSGFSGSTKVPLLDLLAFDYAESDAGIQPVAGPSSSITPGPGGVLIDARVSFH
eukprot:15363329-Ditylum_brightwellii.AAC.1